MRIGVLKRKHCATCYKAALQKKEKRKENAGATVAKVEIDSIFCEDRCRRFRNGFNHCKVVSRTLQRFIQQLVSQRFTARKTRLWGYVYIDKDTANKSHSSKHRHLD